MEKSQAKGIERFTEREYPANKVFRDAWKNPKQRELKDARAVVRWLYFRAGDAWKNPKQRELKDVVESRPVVFPDKDAWKNPKQRELKALLRCL